MEYNLATQNKISLSLEKKKRKIQHEPSVANLLN